MEASDDKRSFQDAVYHPARSFDVRILRLKLADLSEVCVAFSALFYRLIISSCAMSAAVWPPPT
jgi:hypothetical protein